MNWFAKRKALDVKTIANWLYSIRNSRDRDNFRAMRKQVQAAMLNQVITQIIQPSNQTEEHAAYLLIHFFSGRAFLPLFSDTLAATPEATAIASKLFDGVTKPKPVDVSDELRMTAIYSVSFEITNEAIEEHYTEALTLANFGVDLWPDVGELWRQRGILLLTRGEYSEALDNLNRGNACTPGMSGLAEPVAFALKQMERS